MGVRTGYALCFGYAVRGCLNEGRVKTSIIDKDPSDYYRLTNGHKNEPVWICEGGELDHLVICARDSVTSFGGWNDHNCSLIKVDVPASIEWQPILDEFVRKHGFHTFIDDYFSGPHWFIVTKVS